MTIYCHSISQDVHVAIFLRKPLGECFPFISSRSASIDAQFSIGWKVFRVALDRNHIYGVGFVRMNVHHETKIGWQVAADFVPGFTRIITPHNVPMFLHK